MQSILVKLTDFELDELRELVLEAYDKGLENGKDIGREETVEDWDELGNVTETAQQDRKDFGNRIYVITNNELKL